jgi:CDP-2,3-bis-(O-geranylgeranyl)-sn-glycerol synthase
MVEAILSDLPLEIRDTLIGFFPAYLANMFPVLLLKTGFLKSFRTPVDLKAKIFGERILGDHKTFYGVITAIIGGAIGVPIALLMFRWVNGEYAYFSSDTLTNVFDYVLMAFTGAWIGLGAICGDMLKSFFKRRLKIAPGKSWFFFDQVDFILGAWVAMMIMKLPVESKYLIIALIITPLLHLGTNVIAYKLKMKKVWW